jgi:uncharacterized protein (DUF1501 family)
MEPTLHRRSFLKGLGLAGGALLCNGAFARLAFGAGGRDLLVSIFLRGGLDALNAVVPAHEAAYFDARPTIAVPESLLLPLDGSFGLHPKLAPLHPHYTAGRLAIVHAAGNPDPTRSHFKAQASMERASDPASPVTTGWIDRHLSSTWSSTRTAFGGLSVGDTLPASLQGPAAEISMRHLDDVSLLTDPFERARYEAAMWSLYGAAAAPLFSGCTMLDAFAEAEAAASLPASTVAYPDGELGAKLGDVARLVRANVGLEAVALDFTHWDFHLNIGSPETGRLGKKLGELAGSLAAFVQDLGTKFSTTTIVVMSEFGRRLAENGGGGTDHGHGGCIFVLGGGIRGGKVYGTWPGLSPSSLDRGDLAITTDYRDVLAEVVAGRLGNPNLSAVFPGYTPKPVGLVI